MSPPSLSPVDVKGLSDRIRQFMAAIKRDDITAALALSPRVTQETRLAALRWSAVHAPLPTLETLAGAWFTPRRLLPDRLNDPFDAAVRSQRWESLECLLKHVPPGGLSGETVLLLACLNRTPPLLVDKLVKACQSKHITLPELWDKTFQDAVFHEHHAWLAHAWRRSVVSEAARVKAMLRSVDRGCWTMIDALVALGPFRDVSLLVKAGRSPASQTAVDQVVSRLPASVARVFMDQLPEHVRPKMALTHLRLLGADRHDQAIAQRPPPVARAHRQRC